MGYVTKFVHDVRVGQTVYFVDAERVRCSACKTTAKWKYYVKTAKITGMSWYMDNKRDTAIHYYCRKNNNNLSIDDTIFTRRKDAEEECIIRQKEDE